MLQLPPQMEVGIVGESAHHFTHSHDVPEASSDDCSAVHLQHPSLTKGETSSLSSRQQFHNAAQQVSIQRPFAAPSQSASTKASSRKRKQPEPAAHIEEDEQTAQLADASSGISHAQPGQPILTDKCSDRRQGENTRKRRQEKTATRQRQVRDQGK